MREIKFRAWDTISKRWLDTDEFLYIDGDFLSYDKYHQEPGGIITDYVKVMQYTGLKDKNGNTSVEVYEGDIIDVDGKVKGNIYEMDAGETDLVIQGFGTKTWCKTYNEAISRGCHDSE